VGKSDQSENARGVRKGLSSVALAPQLVLSGRFWSTFWGIPLIVTPVNCVQSLTAAKAANAPPMTPSPANPGRPSLVSQEGATGARASAARRSMASGLSALPSAHFSFVQGGHS
jgi:hypothetical protein